MEFSQIVNTILHLGLIFYISGLFFIFIIGMPKPTPRTQKKPLQDAPEAPQTQTQVESHHEPAKQAVSANFAELPLKDLKSECRKRGIAPIGDARKRSSLVEALS